MRGDISAKCKNLGRILYNKKKLAVLFVIPRTSFDFLEVLCRIYVSCVYRERFRMKRGKKKKDKEKKKKYKTMIYAEYIN